MSRGEIRGALDAKSGGLRGRQDHASGHRRKELLPTASPQCRGLLLNHSSLHSIHQLLDVMLVLLCVLLFLLLTVLLRSIETRVHEMRLHLLNGSGQLRRDANDLLVVGETLQVDIILLLSRGWRLTQHLFLFRSSL